MPTEILKCFHTGHIWLSLNYKYRFLRSSLPRCQFMPTFHRAIRKTRFSRFIRPSESFIPIFIFQSFIPTDAFRNIFSTVWTSLKNYQCDRFPFDWQTPIGFMICFVTQSATVFCATSLFVLTLALVMGICNFGASFVSDIKENLRSFNDEITLSTVRRLSAQEWMELNTKLNGIMQFHADAKELSFYTTYQHWFNKMNYTFFCLFQVLQINFRT